MKLKKYYLIFINAFTIDEIQMHVLVILFLCENGYGVNENIWIGSEVFEVFVFDWDRSTRVFTALLTSVFFDWRKIWSQTQKDYFEHPKTKKWLKRGKMGRLWRKWASFELPKVVWFCLKDNFSHICLVNRLKNYYFKFIIL